MDQNKEIIVATGAELYQELANAKLAPVLFPEIAEACRLNSERAIARRQKRMVLIAAFILLFILLLVTLFIL